jgi:hypothetical protein
MTKKSIEFEKISDEDSRRAAMVPVVENIAKVIFFFFEEDQENLDDEEEMENFSSYIWTISSSAVATLGIKIIGKDEKGRYVALINPEESVKNFLIKEDIGEEDHIFYEDYLEEATPDSGFGIHDERIVASAD